MNLDISLDFNELFDKAFTALANAMNIAEETLLPILVKQMFIEGVTGIVFFSISFTLLIFSIILLFKAVEKRSENITFTAFAGLLIFGLATLFMLLDGYVMDSITKTFNPEYAVIEKVVEMASSLVKGD